MIKIKYTCIKLLSKIKPNLIFINIIRFYVSFLCDFFIRKPFTPQYIFTLAQNSSHIFQKMPKTKTDLSKTKTDLPKTKTDLDETKTGLD